MQNHLSKFVVVLAALALCHSNSWAKEHKKRPPVDGKALAEKFIRPVNGQTALVFNEKGQVISINKDGAVMPSCQPCSAKLEETYGPQCKKARLASELLPLLNEGKVEENSSTPLICDKLTNTTIQTVNPITVIEHTGSQCVTFLVQGDSGPKIFQYCW
jgi:hypothetical protein